jgi:Zn-dependent protease
LGVDQHEILQRVMTLVPMILSLTVHEWAHAWSAFRLGDDTAARQGRLTLNPLVHIDLLGTLLLPLMGIPFGWAKPVPVNPTRFRRTITMRTGMMLTAAAGPLSNVILAIVCTVAAGLLLRFRPDVMLGTIVDGTVRSSPVSWLLQRTIAMNVALALFNMLPVPPLDGSRVVDGLIPYRWREYWERYLRWGSIGLVVAVLAGSYILSAPLAYAFSLLGSLIGVVAGVG